MFDRDIVETIGIKDAASSPLVTSGDNSNLVSARIAKKHYRVHRWWLVSTIRWAQIYQRLGIQTVATVRWTVEPH